MTVKTRRLLLAFAALGLGASAWSSYVHHALLTRPGYATFCDINATVSCTQAYLSHYGSLWGVPVAILGVFFFAVVLLLVGPGGRSTVPGRENIPAYVFALSTIGLGVVLYLAWASIFRLQAVCMLCVVTYVAVIGLFVVSGGASSTPMAALPRRAAKDAGALLKSPVALALAIVFSAGAVALLTAFPRDTHETMAAAAADYPPITDQERFQLIQWFNVQPRTDLGIDSEGARVVVAKFNDYQCPACREAYLANRALEAKYTPTGDVKFVTKHFPLEPECNPAVQVVIHAAACEAAAAVLMAEEHGTADKLEEWLFANLPRLDVPTVRQAAADVGNIPDFDARYANTLATVRAHAELGARAEVNSTPTFFVNGVRIPRVLPPTWLEALIQHELQRTS
jgi:uncharacterized membrane protein